MILPLALPGIVAGSIFTFSLTLGDYITPMLVGGTTASSSATSSTTRVNQSSNLPFAAAFAVVPLAVMGVYLADRAPPGRVRGALMERRGTRIGLGVWVALVLAFLYIPIGLICLYAFNSSNVQSWPIAGLHRRSGSRPRSHNGDMQDALVAVAEGGRARDGDRARARLGGGVRRAPLPLLRPRGDLVPARAADRAARGSSPAWR